MARGAPLRRSRSRSTSVASLTGVEAGVHRQLRRRSSDVRPSSTVGEGSNSRKRGRSPLEDGPIANKRTRTSGPSNTQTMETVQEETTTLGELTKDTTDGNRREQGLVSHERSH